MDVDDVTLAGVQLAGSGSFAVRTTGAARGLRIRDSLVRGMPTLQYESTAPRFEFVNNVLLHSAPKSIATRFGGDPHATPVACSDGPDCSRPACREDHDCRIPFLDTSRGALAKARSLSGAGPRCIELSPQSASPQSRVGRCDVGLVDQALITDNILIGGGGFDSGGGPWVRTRIQRNHLENTAGQELLDAGAGAAYVWVLDNVSFGSSVGGRGFVLGPGAPSGPARGWLHHVAVENNLIYRATAPWRAAGPRDRLRLGRGGGALIQIAPSRRHPATRATAVRVVGNTVIDRPGSREWGAPPASGLRLRGVRDAVVSDNLVVVDTPAPLTLSLAGVDEPASVHGVVTRNLAIGTGRSDYLDNLCEPGAPVQMIDASATSVESSGNRATQPGRSADSRIARDARHWLLAEPLPPSPTIDAELAHQRVVPTLDEARRRAAEWPAYEPALLDGALAPRPERREAEQ
jgi:hypothetical protein